MATASWIEPLERFLVRRHSVLTRGALRVLNVIRPGIVETRRGLLEHFEATRRVSVVAPSDADPDLFRRLQWGDHWVKHELIKALGELGYLVTDVDPDVVIHLFGTEARLPRRAVKVLWHYSHPERIDRRVLERYDRVFCASEHFVAKLRGIGVNAETLWPGTSRSPAQRLPVYDLVFVGNARNDGRRRVVEDVGHPDCRFTVWGRGYRNLPARYWAGPYLDYGCLNEVYGASLVALNDHHPSMADEGFVNPRVFDIVASGGFCISDVNPGITTLFGDAVPQYRHAAELREMVDYFVKQPERRGPLMDRARGVALAHNWVDVARRLLGGLEPAWNGSSGTRTR